MSDEKKYSSGFSLMEVNIAIALVSVGLLACFSLFPMGLKESELSVADTHEAMFASHVLSAMASNALHIKYWDHWKNPDHFKELVTDSIPPLDSGEPYEDTLPGGGIAFPDDDDSGKRIRYQFRVLSSDGEELTEESSIYMLQLKVRSGVYGEFKDACNTYCCLVRYMGRTEDL